MLHEPPSVFRRLAGPLIPILSVFTAPPPPMRRAKPDAVVSTPPVKVSVFAELVMYDALASVTLPPKVLFWLLLRAPVVPGPFPLMVTPWLAVYVAPLGMLNCNWPPLLT